MRSATSSLIKFCSTGFIFEPIQNEGCGWDADARSCSLVVAPPAKCSFPGKVSPTRYHSVSETRRYYIATSHYNHYNFILRHTSRPGVRSQPVQGRHIVCESSTCRSYFLRISRVIFVSFSNLSALGRVAVISPLR